MADTIEKKVLGLITPAPEDRKKLEETIKDLKEQVNKEIIKK